MCLWLWNFKSFCQILDVYSFNLSSFHFIHRLKQNTLKSPSHKVQMKNNPRAWKVHLLESPFGGEKLSGMWTPWCCCLLCWSTWKRSSCGLLYDTDAQNGRGGEMLESLQPHGMAGVGPSMGMAGDQLHPSCGRRGEGCDELVAWLPSAAGQRQSQSWHFHQLLLGTELVGRFLTE